MANHDIEEIPRHPESRESDADSLMSAITLTAVNLLARYPKLRGFFRIREQVSRNQSERGRFSLQV